MCLDVDGAGTANGTVVDLYTATGPGRRPGQPQSNGELRQPRVGPVPG